MLARGGSKSPRPAPGAKGLPATRSAIGERMKADTVSVSGRHTSDKLTPKPSLLTGKELLQHGSSFLDLDPMDSPRSVSSSVLNSPLKRAPGKPSSHIRVVVRVRPVNALEKEKGHAAIISSAEDGKGVQVRVRRRRPTPAWHRNARCLILCACVTRDRRVVAVVPTPWQGIAVTPADTIDVFFETL